MSCVGRGCWFSAAFARAISNAPGGQRLGGVERRGRTVPEPLHELFEADELFARPGGKPRAEDDATRRVVETAFDLAWFEVADGILGSIGGVRRICTGSRL